MNTGTILGFGDIVEGVSGLGGAIDITLLGNLAFDLPRDGVLDAISASFTTTVGLSLIGSTATVYASVYSAPAGSNSFTLLPGGTVTLSPNYTGLISVGDTVSGALTGLNIPVTAGTRLMLVFHSDITTGLDVASILTGQASGGISIV